MNSIDFRSDTVTLPTEEMIQASASARLGDDVWEDDPTVKELETYAAQLVGMESALFVPSGTQANLIALLSLTKPGDEFLVDSNAHIYYYEGGGFSSIAGISPKLINSNDGIIRPEDIINNVRPRDVHFPNPKLLCLENTHNRFGGRAISPSDIEKAVNQAKNLGLKVHMDGARIFNASIYHKVDVKRYTEGLDTIQFCLSKGLSAPIGSIIAGSEEVIKIAKRKRKLLGGGMRQVGVIAAPGLVALKKMIDRLEDDHKTARKLAEGLKSFGFDLVMPQTNIVVVNTNNLFKNTDEAIKFFYNLKIFVTSFGENRIRFTTHRHTDDLSVKEALDRIKSAMNGL